MDVHGSPFYIHNVNFTTGDDNVAVHANHTIVENSYFGTGHGASIGSLCNDYLANITFRNITFHRTTHGARIKTDSNCSGHVTDVFYEDLSMYDVAQAIDVSEFYHTPDKSQERSKFLIDNIVFKNIIVTQSSERMKELAEAGMRSGDDDDAMVDFDCDTYYKGANCYVEVDKLHFVGFGEENHPQMACKGTVATKVKDLKGINNCLS